MGKILVIDDDIDICNLLTRFLGRRGHEVDYAISGGNGLDKIKSGNFDLVFCDFRLRDMEGREVLAQVNEISPGTRVIIITGYSDIKIAVEVMRLGAFDYLIKPLIPDEVINLVNKALEEPAPVVQVARKENTTAPKSEKAKAAPEAELTVRNGQRFVRGTDRQSKQMYDQINLVAPTNFSVIIYGESGSGKENIARTIHETSQRKSKPFVAIDCGALTKELAGSELWGHEKGSFTGAQAAKPGQFEIADGGTIFLDEIANLSYDIQVGLLRLVQERKLRRIGGTKDIEIDVRIIVASNENLMQAVKDGRFREDLFYRFNEFSIHVPSLRDRKDDMMLFADNFLQMANDELGKNLNGFEPEVIEFFQRYSWPGNLREMRNIIRRAALLSDGEQVRMAALPQELIYFDKFNFSEQQQLVATAAPQPTDNSIQIPLGGQTPLKLKDAAAVAEAEVLKKVLEEVKYNRTKASKILGIDRKTLFNKMKQYDL